jgi:hypothetical protein
MNRLRRSDVKDFRLMGFRRNHFRRNGGVRSR